MQNLTPQQLAEHPAFARDVRGARERDYDLHDYSINATLRDYFQNHHGLALTYNEVLEAAALVK